MIYRFFREGGVEITDGRFTCRWTPEDVAEFLAAHQKAQELFRPIELPAGEE